MDVKKLFLGYTDLINEAQKAAMTNTRSGHLAAADLFKEASSLGDVVGGVHGAERRANADQFLSTSLLRLGDHAAAARVACSSLRAARESGGRTWLVKSLSVCGDTARVAPGEMANAERESRKQERLSGSPTRYGGLDLSQEGRISLPTTMAALSRLELAYHLAAVAICDAALFAAGGRGSPAAADVRRVPSLHVEARARGFLGACLQNMGEEGQRGLELMRTSVTFWRQVVRAAAPGVDTLSAERMLADQLSSLGGMLKAHGSYRMAEAEACLREALALGKGSGDVLLSVTILTYLINLCGKAHATVGRAEAEALRSRLNLLLVQMGRSRETSCSICLEPLAPPADGAAEDAAGGGSGPLDSCVCVMGCHHQFHRGCVSTWLRAAPIRACPLCKK